MVGYSHTMNIRPVQLQDFDQWKVLWDGYNAFYERVGPTALPENITQTTWQRFFDTYEPVHALVAEVDGQLLGLVHYLYHRSTTSIGPNCYLQDLFTAEAARGKGVGRALIDAVIDISKAAGCGRLYWHTRESNVTAQRLYNQVAEGGGVMVYRKIF
ncbi:GNAT family N-acetyltransferase [Ramlibacter sp. WS9]|uniref:GNAT family N-acetyltransferase n=1 Tax=Ramlibacter sp. WS9 TaxID=1882741 RepID=UPI0011435902|nr:GNAT family N-acetyltransferase [Ramlibacter sp. WS9]ROZ64964.1 GNAT family N-acetyltransferase [Ramlibacter sp. WS9]